jgi:arylsulfatase B
MEKQNLIAVSKYRNHILGFSALGFSAMLVTSVTSCSSGKSTGTDTTKPNFIIILADDLGWHDVGYHGSEIVTPNIDRLASTGIEFDRFYVCSVSSPTRASLLTGRFPSRYGILTPLGDEPGLPAGTVTIAGLLQKNGYDTGISGKWHLGAVPEGRPMHYGFSSSYGSLRGQIDPYTHLYKNGDKTWQRNDSLIDEEGHATDLITKEAIRFISIPRDKGKPFFLYVAYTVPHTPLQEPKEYTDFFGQIISNESRRDYAASVRHLDFSVGRIMEAVKNMGIEENTVVMFLSDNGGQKSWSSKTEYGGKFKPNDVLGNNLPLRDWKGSLYDGALRVPAVLVWPGKLEHKKIEEPVNVTDIYPTLASLAGAEIPEELNIEGISFWPVIQGESSSKDRILYWKSNKGTALQKDGWKLIHNGKAIEKGTDELYNIKLDPYETKDVAGENMDKVKELKELIQNNLSLDPKGERPSAE